MNDQDQTILLAALSERYESMRVIRSRVQDTALWILGVFLGAGGWLITTATELSNAEKFWFVLAIGAAFIAVRFYYLADLEKGFQAQQRVAANIENALGLFTADRFGTSGTSIYPVEWKDAGTSAGAGKFISTSYWLIYVASAVLLSAIILKNVVF